MVRGDVFISPVISSLLRFVNVIPIYRREEGAEHFPKNEITFSFCIEVFKKGGTVLIFTEGQSENEWDLRPLRKGTARLAYNSWYNNRLCENLKILPTTINYSSWLKINGIAYISFLQKIEKDNFPKEMEQGVYLNKFNEKLKSSLAENCIILNKKENLETQQIITGFLLKNFKNGKELTIKGMQDFNSGTISVKEQYKTLAGFLKSNKISYFKQTNTFIFLISLKLYCIAFIMNGMPYSISKSIAKRTMHFNEFYDSTLFLLLLLIYPVYLIVLSIIMYYITHSVLFCLALISIILISAKFREWGKRNIECYIKREKLKTVSSMLEELFQKKDLSYNY